MKKYIVLFFVVFLLGLAPKAFAADSEIITLSDQLHNAVDGWDIKEIRELLRQGADPCTPDSKGNDALARLYADNYSDEEVGSDSESDWTDSIGDVEDEKLELVKVLIEHGANPKPHLKHVTVSLALWEIQDQQAKQDQRERRKKHYFYMRNFFKKTRRLGRPRKSDR